MLKYILPILIVCAVCSCGSKDSTSENNVNAVENTEFTPVESSSYPQGDSYNSGTEVTTTTTTVNTSSGNENSNANGSGYQYGYDMGYIAGESNMEYNPYLPNTASYPMAYRQEYCRGYDAGYQDGQQAAGRPSDHVNTGDEPEEIYIEYYDDEEY